MTLQQLWINHRHWDARTRAAGLLLLGRKVKPKTIAGQLDVSDQSVYNEGSCMARWRRVHAHGCS